MSQDKQASIKPHPPFNSSRVFLFSLLRSILNTQVHFHYTYNMYVFLKYEFAVRVRDLLFTTEDFQGVGTCPHSQSVPSWLYEFQHRVGTHPRNRWKVRQHAQGLVFSLSWYIWSCSRLTPSDWSKLLPWPTHLSWPCSILASFCALLFLVDIKLICMLGQTLARTASWEFSKTRTMVCLKVPLFMQ